METEIFTHQKLFQYRDLDEFIVTDQDNYFLGESDGINEKGSFSITRTKNDSETFEVTFRDYTLLAIKIQLQDGQTIIIRVDDDEYRPTPLSFKVFEARP